LKKQLGEIIMKKITVALLVVSILTVGLVGLVFAQKRGGEGFGGRGGFPPFLFNKIANELELSDEQKAQIKQILESSKERIAPLMLAMKEGHQTAKTLGTNGTFDEAAVNALATQQSQTMKQLIIEKEKTKAQVFAVLNESQRTKAQEIMKNFEGKMKGRFGHRGKFGGFEGKGEKQDEE
jgi:Spy/CpxP family protein refolding chaperone